MTESRLTRVLLRAGAGLTLAFIYIPLFLIGLYAFNRSVTQGWQIENYSHWVRDVTFDEDRSQVRCSNIPQVMAALRNTVIGLMRWAGHTNIAAACRRFAAQPQAALHLIGIALEN